MVRFTVLKYATELIEESIVVGAMTVSWIFLYTHYFSMTQSYNCKGLSALYKVVRIKLKKGTHVSNITPAVQAISNPNIIFKWVDVVVIHWNVYYQNIYYTVAVAAI